MRRLALALVLLAACGSEDTGGTIVGPSTTAGGGSTLGTQLTISVDDGGGETRDATLECGDTPSGTGHLADPSAAAAACELLSTPEIARRLVEGPPRDRMCTQQYGGPETARIVGTLDGQPVDASFHRTDGCGIGEWDTFRPLLG